MQEGWTPLHRASRSGRVEVCKLLLENGAETDAKTKVRFFQHAVLDSARIMQRKGRLLQHLNLLSYDCPADRLAVQNEPSGTIRIDGIHSSYSWLAFTVVHRLDPLVRSRR